MVRIAAATVLAFAVSTMALEAVPADAAALRARQDAEVPKPETPEADSPEDFKKWMESIAETAKMLEQLAREAAENHGKAE